jgi:hypothetical protein
MKADGGRSSWSTSRKGTLKQGGVSGEYTETQGGSEYVNSAWRFGRDNKTNTSIDGGRSSWSTSRKGTLKHGVVSGEYTETQGGSEYVNSAWRFDRDNRAGTSIEVL